MSFIRDPPYSLEGKGDNTKLPYDRLGIPAR